MIYFVGAGSGAPDLITVRGKQLIETADILIYAGSLVNPELLLYAGPDCKLYNSAEMTLEEVFKVMEEGELAGEDTVRLHTGDPCLYGAIREQMDLLDEKELPYDYCPGVSSFCGAASALNLEYTLPDVSQSVIITRMAGRTPVPEEQTFLCTVGTLCQTVREHGITKTALIIVGDAVSHHHYKRSKLYDPEFTTGYRKGIEK